MTRVEDVRPPVAECVCKGLFDIDMFPERHGK